MEDSSVRLNSSGKAKSPRLLIMVDNWRRFKGGKLELRRKIDRMFVKLQMDRCLVVHVEGQEDMLTWFYNLTADLGMKRHKFVSWIT